MTGRSSVLSARCRSGTIPIGLSCSGSRSGPSFPRPLLHIAAPLSRPLFRLVNGQRQNRHCGFFTSPVLERWRRCENSSLDVVARVTGQASRLAREEESPRGSPRSVNHTNMTYLSISFLSRIHLEAFSLGHLLPLLFMAMHVRTRINQRLLSSTVGAKTPRSASIHLCSLPRLRLGSTAIVLPHCPLERGAS